MSFWFKILLFLPESSDDMSKNAIDLVWIGSICSVYCQGWKCHITHQAQIPAAFHFLEILVEEDYLCRCDRPIPKEYLGFGITVSYYRRHFDIDLEFMDSLK